MSRPSTRAAVPLGAIAAAFLVGACGSSSTSTGSESSAASSSAGAGSESSAASSAAGGGDGASGPAAAAYTIGAASVAGAGTVLVNGNGMTLYILTSEKGGKITCTDASGCTNVWPDTELPSGVSAPVAGAGIQPSLLSTVTSSDGKLYATYAGYPLYTFAPDQKGSAKGQGIKSFGGTWEAMNPDGTPVGG